MLKDLRQQQGCLLTGYHAVFCFGRSKYLNLEHILSAIEAILQFTEGMDAGQFYQNDMVQSAVIRKFEIMGEAAKRIPEDLRNDNPDIPWKQMAGFRDVLIHDYNDLNLETVWVTVRAYLPATKESINHILGQLL